MKPGYDYIHEFAYGIEFILDGLERARTTPSPHRRPTEVQPGMPLGNVVGEWIVGLVVS